MNCSNKYFLEDTHKTTERQTKFLDFGVRYNVRTGYISKEGQYPEKKETYFLPENVKRRWLGELNDQREILMIEFLTFDIMKEFGYKPIYKKIKCSKDWFLPYLRYSTAKHRAFTVQ